jgi:DNA/RNA endonuclease G (NUC1)
VPDALFKIVLRTLDNGRVKTLCFLIPNIVPVDKKYSEFVCSIDAVEAATGLDFLTNISIEEQAHVESLGENIDPDERMEMVLLW